MDEIESKLTKITEDFKITKSDELAIKALLDGILPSLKKFIVPISAKLDEFLGDDKNIVVLRNIKGSTYVFVIDTSGPFEVSNGKLLVNPDKVKVFDVKSFIDLFVTNSDFKVFTEKLGI